MTVREKKRSIAVPAGPIPAATAGGLDDVVVARTALSHVDGAGGRLTIAGLPLRVLAAQPLETVATRLWRAARGLSAASASGDTSGDTSGDAFRAVPPASLGAGRAAAWARQGQALDAARGLEPMDALIAAMAAIGPRGPAADAGGATEEPEAAACRLAGTVAVLLPALLRREAGLAPIAPDPDLPHAADLLRMLRGSMPDEAEADGLNRYLVTVSDHGLNASTFAARVVASTRAGMPAAVLAALCALKGPLHGGAPGPVLDMLDQVAAQPDARAWVRDRLDAGERIMGFGHRVYRVRDPRADVLRAAAASLRSPRLAAAAVLEDAVLAELAAHRPGRRLETNVEYMTAILLDALGLDRRAFTALFASGRVIGWTAHVMEQERTGRLIRPQSDYAGPVAA